MSLVHPIVVGHFDLSASNIRCQVCTRPLNETRAKTILAHYRLPKGEDIIFRGGYIECRCCLFSEAMMDFIREVAEGENCYAIELTQWEILFRPRDA